MKKYLIIPDCHFPYEDKKALLLIHKAIQQVKPFGLIILGDFADFYSVSSHDKNPNRNRDLQWELEEVNKGLRKFDEYKFIKDKRFISGNHEDRLERYLMQKAPELFNMVKIPELFQLAEHGWQYIPYKQHTKIGKVFATHDTGKAGKYAHYQSMADFQSSVVIGHTHRFGYAVEGNAKGKPHVAVMLGWLGDVNQVDYMHRIKALRDWALGFGIGYVLPDGYTHITPVPIVDYTAIVEGKLIK